MYQITVTILPAVATAAAIIVVTVVVVAAVVSIGDSTSNNVSQRPMTENINFCYTRWFKYDRD